MFDKLTPWKKHHDDSNGGRMSVRQGDDPITALRRDFDNLLSRLWDEGGLARSDSSGLLSASVDFDEDEKEYVMTVELPGFEPDEIDVKLSGNVLTIRAEHQEESQGSNGRSRRYGSFYESFTLPSGGKADGVDARYHNGVLEVHVPKDESKPSRRIEVKAA